MKVDLTAKKKILLLGGSAQQVIAYASDPAAPTAAYVSEQLGLPGNPYDSVEILCNKDRFRKFLKEHDFCVPAAKGYADINTAVCDVWYVEHMSFLTDCMMCVRLVQYAFDRKNAKARATVSHGRGTFMGYDLDGKAINLEEVPQEYIDRAPEAESTGETVAAVGEVAGKLPSDAVDASSAQNVFADKKAITLLTEQNKVQAV